MHNFRRNLPFSAYVCSAAMLCLLAWCLYDIYLRVVSRFNFSRTEVRAVQKPR